MTKKVLRLIGSLVVLGALAIGVTALLTTPTAEAGGGRGGQMCGGIAGIECPNPNQVCVDDPRDNCDPKTGGRDCSGLCRGPGGGNTR